MAKPFAWLRDDGDEGYEFTQEGDGLAFPVYKHGSAEYVLYGYGTPSGKLYASGMDALQAGEQRWFKVYVNKEDLK